MAGNAFAVVHKQAEIGKAPASGILQRRCSGCRKKKATLQRSKASSATVAMPNAFNKQLSPVTADVVRSALKEPHFIYSFSQIPVHSSTVKSVQAKLIQGFPGDRYEQEADRVADQVLAKPVERNGTWQRIKPFSGSTKVQTESAPHSTDYILPAPGRPMEPALQREMEGRFGHDFSRVRVHPGAEAGQSAREMNARAYTVGQNIMFGTGQFAPGTREGRRLIAHELTHVVQQEKGSIGLQRQPQPQPQDIDTLLNEARGTVEELEEIRKLLREGAEDLEVVRWQFALAGKKLPTTSTKVANKDLKSDAASFAEGLIETSKVLYPYLTGKLVRISVAKNFKIYDFRSEFETKHDELAGNVSPSIGKAKPQTQDFGFYHRKSDSIHLAPDATFGQVLHEAIHKYSEVAIQNALGIFFNEGVTQYFTDLVAAENRMGAINHTYGPNLKCANTVLGWINNDRATFGRAYFQGAANPLLQKVMQKLDIKTARELIRLREDRGGLGLCEEIEKKGP